MPPLQRTQNSRAAPSVRDSTRAIAHVWLPLDRLRAALAAWDVDPREIAPLERGATADVWRVDTAGGATWVAKYTYMEPDEVEPGLHAAAAADAAGLRSATPLPTRAGGLTAMVEWPEGVQHPLALIRYLPGREVRLHDCDPGAMGDLYGRLQCAIASVASPSRDERLLQNLSWFASGPHEEAAALGREVAALIREVISDGGLTVSTAIWDGPEMMVGDDGEIGFYDFGATGSMPVANHVANRCLSFDRDDGGMGDGGMGDGVERFVAAFTRRFPLGDGDVSALPAFMAYSYAIYARYCAERALDEDSTPEVRAQWSQAAENNVAGMRRALSRAVDEAPGPRGRAFRRRSGPGR